MLHVPGTLGNDDQNQAAIAAAGGIPPLVALVTSGNDAAKLSAAGALLNLALNDQNQAAIAGAGGIPPLIALVTSGINVCEARSCKALGHLATNDQNKAAIVAAGGVQALQEMAKDGKMLENRELAEVAQNAWSIFPASPAVQRVAPSLAMIRRRSRARRSSGVRWDAGIWKRRAEGQSSRAARNLGSHFGWEQSGHQQRRWSWGIGDFAGDWRRWCQIACCGPYESRKQLWGQGSHPEGWWDCHIGACCEAREREGEEAADEALKLLSLKQAAGGHGIIAEGGAADTIPTGEGTRVAMFSARFDGAQLNRCSAGVSHFEVFFLPLVSSLQVNYVKSLCIHDQYSQFGFGIPFLALVKSLSLWYLSAAFLRKMRKVFQILCDRKYDILMVAADAGQQLRGFDHRIPWRLHKEHGTMIAVCTKHYGE